MGTLNALKESFGMNS